ncbi:hypothetical protein MJG53_016374 [Ovis ammon polii x Ovis aries]|uniref:Uncharacterized protein n=1 Tax=Ovis ammon polii x Ovis aries TaxID=2918886 RepID=A0ACB9UC52_9CETA|nr:hypothetical protein MJG53_016374 [Ovis ammon polii x Ovis aries]
MASVCINGTGSQGTFQLRVAAVTVSVETMNHRRSTWDALWQHLTCVTDVSCDTAVAMEDLKEACNTKPNYMYLGDFRFRGKGQQREAMKSSLPKSNKRPLENHGIKVYILALCVIDFYLLYYLPVKEYYNRKRHDCFPSVSSSSRMKCDKQSDTKGAQPSYGSANSLPCLPSTPMENTIIPLHCDSLTLQNPSFDDGLIIFTSKYGYLTDEERSEKPSLLPQARVGQTGSSAYGQEAPGQHQEEPSVCGPLFKRLTDGDSGKLLLLQHEADEYGLNIKTELGKSVPECRMISFSVIHMARGIPTAAQIISKELIQKRSYQTNAINTNPKRQQGVADIQVPVNTVEKGGKERKGGEEGHAGKGKVVTVIERSAEMSQSSGGVSPVFQFPLNGTSSNKSSVMPPPQRRSSSRFFPPTERMYVVNGPELKGFIRTC